MPGMTRAGDTRSHGEVKPYMVKKNGVFRRIDASAGVKADSFTEGAVNGREVVSLARFPA